MPLVASYQIVGAGGVRAFEELVIVGILRNLERVQGSNPLRMIPYKLEELLLKAAADLEFRAREHPAILLQDSFRDVQPRRFCHREQEHGSLESFGFQGGRDKYVGIEDEA